MADRPGALGDRVPRARRDRQRRRHTTPFSSSTPRLPCVIGSPCSDPVEQETGSKIPTSVPHGDAAAQLLTGLGPDDRLRDGGYDAEDFKLGPTYVVERAGQTIARLVLGAPADTWSATLWTCEGRHRARGAASAAPPETAGTTELIPTSSSCGARVLGRCSSPTWCGCRPTACMSATDVGRDDRTPGRRRRIDRGLRLGGVGAGHVRRVGASGEGVGVASPASGRAK